MVVHLLPTIQFPVTSYPISRGCPSLTHYTVSSHKLSHLFMVVHLLPTIQFPVTSYPISHGCPSLTHCTVSCHKLSHLSWLFIFYPLHSFLSQAVPSLMVVHLLPTTQFHVTSCPISHGCSSFTHYTVSCHKLSHLSWLFIFYPLHSFLSQAVPSLMVVHLLPTTQFPVTSCPISHGCSSSTHYTVSCHKLSHLSWLFIFYPLHSFMSQAVPSLEVVHLLPTVKFPVTNYLISHGCSSLTHCTFFCHKLSHLSWLSISYPLYSILSQATPSLMVVHLLPTVQHPVTNYPISHGCPSFTHCTASCHKLSHLSWLSIFKSLHSFQSKPIPSLVVAHLLPTVISCHKLSHLSWLSTFYPL